MDYAIFPCGINWLHQKFTQLLKRPHWRKDLFLGQHHFSFDKNNRVMIPAGFAELLAEGAIVTQGFDRNILVFSKAAFQELAQIIRRLNIADPLARSLHRMLLGNASSLEIDAAGSISLPAKLKEFAGLGQQLVLVGQGDYFEIWSQTSWEPQEAELNDADSNSQRFVSMNLARQ
jgi:MraZ protein